MPGLDERYDLQDVLVPQALALLVELPTKRCRVRAPMLRGCGSELLIGPLLQLAACRTRLAGVQIDQIARRLGIQGLRIEHQRPLHLKEDGPRAIASSRSSSSE